VIDNDSLWFSILYGLATTFRHRVITAEDVVNFINARTGNDYDYFFDQYFRHIKIPQLDAFVSKKGARVTLKYKWNADVTGFRMPVKVTTAPGKYEFIYPTTSWQTMELGGIDPMEFRIADDLFYADLKLGWTYMDIRKPEIQQK
jgi:aminopeptidase N